MVDHGSPWEVQKNMTLVCTHPNDQVEKKVDLYNKSLNPLNEHRDPE